MEKGVIVNDVISYKNALIKESDSEISERILQTYSPLALAFLGDAVYSLYIREAMLKKGNRASGKLHEDAVQFEKATAQAEVYKAIYDELTEEEQNVMRKGRNAKPKSTAKHASVSEYHYATGLEALIGYLYLKGDTERLEYITDRSINM
ncbi:MAG: ribonuclease III [Lachnospiraceae bacterium]|nr:ribonuclease III [Lachnospiraceae bacterium]